MGPVAGIPLPLALVADLGEAGPRRAFLASAPGTGTVVAQVFRTGRPLETRNLASPAAEIVELGGDGVEPVAVRAFAIRAGAVLQLDAAFHRGGDQLVVSLAGLSPDLECVVQAANGAPVPGAMVTAVAVDGEGYTAGIDPRRWGSVWIRPLVTSDNGMGIAAALRPDSASEWGSVSVPPRALEVPLLAGDEPRAMDDLIDPESWRPSLPPVMPFWPVPIPWSSGVTRLGLAAPPPRLWAPRLLTDARGGSRVPFARAPPPGSVWRVGLTALTPDGRWGYLEAIVDAITVADATRAAGTKGAAR